MNDGARIDWVRVPEDQRLACGCVIVMLRNRLFVSPDCTSALGHTVITPIALDTYPCECGCGGTWAVARE